MVGIRGWCRGSLVLAVGLMGLPATAEEDKRVDRLATVLFHGTAGGQEPPPPRTVTPPGAYALSIDGDFDLGGFVFKDGYPFLHNDGGAAYENTALGIDALISTTPGQPTGFFGANNTAVGFAALKDNTSGQGNNALGAGALRSNTVGVNNDAFGWQALTQNTEGRSNVAFGFAALVSNTVGNFNAAVGPLALGFNQTGYSNTAVGFASLLLATTGSRNSALGFYAGYGTYGSDNILIASRGAAESNTLRIGQATGTGYFELNRAFIAGIRGTMTGDEDAIPVLVDLNGQLGTIQSSRRVKEDIHDMGEASAALASLRPVTFRYKRAFDDGEKPIRYGLIAEEVAEVFPDLVAYDEEGRPAAILDHFLVPMLLNELQKTQRRLAVLEEERAALAGFRASHDALSRRLQRLEARVAGTGSLTSP